MLRGNYDEKCDVWSAGVIMFILLAGYPPFYGDKDSVILGKVRKAAYEWPTMEEDGVEFSPEAKDLISKMLTLDETKRPSAKQALTHKWLSLEKHNKNSMVSSQAIANFKNFAASQKFKKIALTCVATQLTDKEIGHLRDTFITLDENGDGTLSLAEIQNGCKKHNVSLPPDFEKMFHLIDSDKSGVIDYTEFIAATMESSFQYREDLCWSAFRVFDVNGDGKITVKELQQSLKTAEIEMPEDKVKEIIAEFDLNKDGVIDFDEFCNMMRAGKI